LIKKLLIWTWNKKIKKIKTTFSAREITKVEECKLAIPPSNHQMKNRSLSIEKLRSRKRKMKRNMPNI